MRFLAIDIGSSFLKGAVLDLDRLSIEHVSREAFPEPRTGLAPGRFEVDPVATLAAAQRLLEKLLSHAPDAAEVVTSTQMGGLLFCDAQGQPLGNYISWRDQRASWQDEGSVDSSFARFAAQLGEPDALALGRDVKPGYMTSLLYWFVERGELPRVPALPMSIGDFVIARLCSSSPIAHPTAACGAVDVGSRTWRSDAWGRLGMGRLLWPNIGHFTDVVGEWKAGGRKLPCYPALGDHACALAGVALEEGELSLNISTGSQVSQLTSEFRSGAYQTRPYLDDRFLNTITHIPAGRALNTLVDLCTEMARLQGLAVADPWPWLVRAAEAASDSELEVDLSFFPGPLGDQGQITGITTENLGIGSLFRAAFRAMARNYATLANRLSPEQRWSRLVFSGGLAQNLEILRRMIREQIPGECRVCPETEDTLRGLLVTALVIAGRASNVIEATRQIAAAPSHFL
ncbi:MAG: FGGY family carbohydrate kinase [Pirellulales bacterium]